MGSKRQKIGEQEPINYLGLDDIADYAREIEKKAVKENNLSSIGSAAEEIVRLKFTSEQNKFFEAVKAGKSVFLTSGGGYGKTFVIQVTCQWLTEKKISFAATATTGIAATHFNGTTFHAWSGLGINCETEPLSNILTRICRSNETWSRWINTQVVIIDEISMMKPSLLSCFDRVARIIRSRPYKNMYTVNPNPDHNPNNNPHINPTSHNENEVLKLNERLPFGGLQVIVVGDFAQLPPVFNRDEKISFCFELPLWQQVFGDNCYTLSSASFRQKGDDSFTALLNRLRLGRPSKSDITRLHSLVVHKPLSSYSFSLSSLSSLTSSSLKTSLAKEEEEDKKETKTVAAIGDASITKKMIMFARRSTVDEYNKKKLEQLLKVHEKKTYLSLCLSCDPNNERSECIEAFIKNQRDNAQAPHCLELCKGAEVMLVANLNLSEGLVNGIRGVITGFTPPGILPVSDREYYRASITPAFCWQEPEDNNNNFMSEDDNAYSNMLSASSISSTSASTPYSAFSLMPSYSKNRIHKSKEVWPNVYFQSLKRTVTIMPRRWEWRDNNGASAMWFQIPLRHAWSFTVQKAQGSSCTKVHIDTRGFFSHGQFYTALSRAKTLEHVTLSAFQTNMIRVHESVRKFYALTRPFLPETLFLRLTKPNNIPNVLINIIIDYLVP